VQSDAVVEGFNVVEDSGASGKATVIDEFMLEAASEGLDENVVVTVTFAAHGSEHAVPCQHCPIGCAGELTARSERTISGWRAGAGAKPWQGRQ